MEQQQLLARKKLHLRSQWQIGQRVAGNRLALRCSIFGWGSVKAHHQQALEVGLRKQLPAVEALANLAASMLSLRFSRQFEHDLKDVGEASCPLTGLCRQMVRPG